MSPLDVFWDRCEGPIVYGANDCCMALADTIMAAGGPDLMDAYRGRYSTARGFVRVIRKAGFSSLPQATEDSFQRGRRVQMAEDFDVAMVGYIDAVGNTVASPGFFHGGFWHVRTERGGAAYASAAFSGVPTIYRLI